MFEGDERFSAVERPRDREDLFESYLDELQKKVNLNILKKKKFTYMPHIFETFHILHTSTVI